MEASVWSGGNGTYGIRVGVQNRALYFHPSHPQIQVEMDGEFKTFRLTAGFWRKCPEFRDSGSATIREWLLRHRCLDWPTGHPPKVELIPLGGSRFRLVG